MIYFDYNASTPIEPVVREAMLPFIGREAFGNPSSNHVMGKPLREAIEKARRQVADLLGASPDEIVFTSGGTEGCNHVIKGVGYALHKQGNHIITTAVEHPAVINPCKFLERHHGFEVTYVGVDSHGWVDPAEVAAEVRPTTVLIAVMHAQNEVGTIQPIAEIAEIAREGGVLMYTDAAQSCGKIETRVDRLGVDLMTIAGHKFYAPQGSGAMYIKRGVTLEPLNHGAGHQWGHRSGTEPVAMLAGLGAAAELALSNNVSAKLTTLRDRLWNGLRAALGEGAVLMGHPTERLPNTLCVGFRDRVGADILAACSGLCASTGSACHSKRMERSAVMAAMDVPEVVAFGAIRFSLGRHTSEAEVDNAIQQLTAACCSPRASVSCA
jgi:cysteine desulfurase